MATRYLLRTGTRHLGHGVEHPFAGAGDIFSIILLLVALVKGSYATPPVPRRPVVRARPIPMSRIAFLETRSLLRPNSRIDV
jgi:hypothetical protein